MPACNRLTSIGSRNIMTQFFHRAQYDRHSLPTLDPCYLVPHDVQLQREGGPEGRHITAYPVRARLQSYIEAEIVSKQHQ